MHDLVIRRGRVIDGNGTAPVEADVAIDGDRITAVGSGIGPGRRELDAAGLLVTPGFVDIHTHYDAQVTWDPYLTPSSWHGCTTVVMGSCGVGFAPAAPDRHEWLIGLMEGVEDIPGAAMTEGMKWGWESYPEFLNTIEATPHAIDFGCQIPHGALRGYVMGDRGAKNEEATAEDVARMAALVEEGLRAGALGFSTSRTLLHKSVDGEPVPGTFAGELELFGIGRALQKVGHGVFQMALEHTDAAQEFRWMKALAAETGRPVMFNLSQVDQEPGLWKQMVGLLEEAAAEDIPVYAQVAGRAIGVLMCWQGTAHPFVAYPSYMPLSQKPWAERWAALQSPEFRAQLLKEEPYDLWPFADFITRTFDKMYPVAGQIDYEPAPDQSVAAIAARTGRTPQEVALDALMSEDGQGMIYFPLFNYADKSLDPLYELHRHPRTLMGLSDAGAHCGAICDGGMPTFMLTHWTRDRARGPRLPLEYVIRRQTRDTAEAFGLMDRGVLAPGYKADVNLIDYERLTFKQPRMAFDLPADGRRLVQRAEGYVASVVSGQVVREGGEFTGAMPGKLIRGPQRR